MRIGSPFSLQFFYKSVNIDPLESYLCFFLSSLGCFCQTIYICWSGNSWLEKTFQFRAVDFAISASGEHLLELNLPPVESACGAALNRNGSTSIFFTTTVNRPAPMGENLNWNKNQNQMVERRILLFFSSDGHQIAFHKQTCTRQPNTKSNCMVHFTTILDIHTRHFVYVLTLWKNPYATQISQENRGKLMQYIYSYCWRNGENETKSPIVTRREEELHRGF